jgi:hypothetical protein
MRVSAVLVPPAVAARDANHSRPHPRTHPATALGGLSDIREVIQEFNTILRGWGGYFRTGNASAKFNYTDSFVRRLLRKLLACRSQRGWLPDGRRAIHARSRINVW